MQIGGFVKNSFVDYPGHIAAVVFVSGCNMDCWYCHNRMLWKPENLIAHDEVFAFLEKRRGFLDGVVISGGEPTLQSGIASFIDRVRAMGYLIKLDTNGLLPKAVEELIDKVDYIALDLKAPPGQLSRVISYDIDDTPIWQTADLLLTGKTDYEFRTTMMPFLCVDDIAAIAQRVQGATKYVIQQYRKPAGDTVLPKAHSNDTIKKAAEAAKEYIKHVQIKGL